MLLILPFYIEIKTPLRAILLNIQYDRGVLQLPHSVYKMLDKNMLFKTARHHMQS